MVDLIPHVPGTGAMPWKSWRVDGDGSADWRYVTFCCPGGHLGSLEHLSNPELQESSHKVAADGKVTPSVVCPADGCGYHEFIQLEGWSPAMREP